MLEKLEEAGLIELPTLEASKRSRGNSKMTDFTIDTTPITGELKEIEPLHLEIARAGMELKLSQQLPVCQFLEVQLHRQVLSFFPSMNVLWNLIGNFSLLTMKNFIKI